MIIRICAFIVAIFAVIAAVSGYHGQNHEAAHWATMCAVWCFMVAFGIADERQTR